MLKVSQYPRNADGTPMDLEVGVLTDATGNGGARLVTSPTGPDNSPIDSKALVLVDQSGNPVSLDGVLQSVFTPEKYLAVGNGVDNDTTAFQLLAAAINAAGGGVIQLRPGATYILGRQNFVNDGSYMWKAETICNINNCAKPVIVRGNGAKIKFAPGMRYGTFDAAGVRTDHAGVYTGGELCAPIVGLEGALTIHDCTGFVYVENLEFDGNFAAFNIGGPWGGGDGYQAPGDLLFLYNNSGGEATFNVELHHGPRDGIQTWRSNLNDNRGTLHVMLDSHHNNRQAVTLSGGRKYTFRHCRLRSTGKARPIAGLETSPGAGVDFEGVYAFLRDILFEQCEIADNFGPGAIADVGDTTDVTFRECRLVGTTSWSVWAAQPRFRFERCLIVGSMVSAVNYSLADAAKFVDCNITFDPTASEYGAVYIGGALGGFNGASGFGHNMRFERCKFSSPVDPGAGAPNSLIQVEQAIICDCEFTGSANTYAGFYTCVFEGKNVITLPSMTMAGNMTPVGVILGGLVTFNGVDAMRGSAIYDPPSLAAGAETSTTVAAPGAALGDYAVASFSLDTQGITLVAEVTSAGVVTIRLRNGTASTLDLASGTLSVRVMPKNGF